MRMDRTIEPAPITAKRPRRFPLRALVLLLAVIGLGACSDQLLPPGPEQQAPAAEPLIYYTDLSSVDPFDTTKPNGFVPLKIMAIRSDGTSPKPIVDGLI